MVAKALTRKGTSLGKMAKCSKDHEPVIETYPEGLAEHHNPDTLKRLAEAERAKKALEQKKYFGDPSIGVEEGNELFQEQKYADALSSYLKVDKIPVMAFRPSLEAKLRELLHNICLHEIKLCSDAAKEFVKLLKGETGGDLLRLYFQSSPDFAELLEAWKIRHGKQGLSYIFLLILSILSHPEGKCRSADIGRAVDQFGRLLITNKLDDIYKALSNSKEGKQQSAALSLLASIVRRGPDMASQMASKFDFQGFARKHKPRRAFVEFAISFLEVGKPLLLESILKQRQPYSELLQGLGEDDEDTVASVLSTLKDKILAEESSLGKIYK